MHILDKPITKQALQELAKNSFGDMVKAVVDVKQQRMAIDAELHSDLEAFLLENKSQQNDVWGINLYPALEGEALVEFDSMINMRPSQGNPSRGVDDSTLRDQIQKIVKKWVVE